MELTTRYYSDERRDDFANTNIKVKPLPEKFKYHSRNPLVVLRRFFIYRVIAVPAVFFTCKVLKRIKYVNKSCMKGYKNRGCFIYGNHTGFIGDAFNPTVLSFPRRAKILTSEDTTSIKGLRWLLLDLGTIPIPSQMHLMSSFNAEIERAISKKNWVAIYPEAHIWPYYTGVRNFSAVSFRYPVRLDAPVFAYTLTYSRRKRSARPRITVYIDGPFFADKSLSLKQAQQKLRDGVYSVMKSRADEHSTYKYKYDYALRPADGESEAAKPRG